ncbi:hypothetical protein [Hyphococcus sp.]|uniref:hypothetical protein n=1 Tax=Hyphococcus sp. TaxID=2038636 RepID=UPI0035C6F475
MATRQENGLKRGSGAFFFKGAFLVSVIWAAIWFGGSQAVAQSPAQSSASEMSSRKLSGAVRFFKDARAEYFHVVMEFRKGGGLKSNVVAVYDVPAGEQFMAADYFPAPDGYGRAGSAYRLHEEETQYFNEKIFPALLKAFPAYGNVPAPQTGAGDIQILGYAKGRHFEDADYFFKTARKNGYVPEQPLIQMVWRRNSPSEKFRPFYEFMERDGWDRASFWNSVEEAKAARTPIGAMSESKGERALEVYRRHEAEKKARQERALADLRRKMEASRRPGVVYKSGAFWSAFDDFETPRRVFEGDFYGVNTTYAFAGYFTAYVEEFYKNCKSALPPTKVPYDRPLVDEETGERLTIDSYLEMDPRFYNAYGRYERRRTAGQMAGGLGDLAEGMAKGGEGGVETMIKGLVQGAAAALNHGAQMASFLRGRCNSATVRQMGENMLRAANGQRSMQASGPPIAGAAMESQPYSQDDIRRAWKLGRLNSALASDRRGDGWPYYTERLYPLSKIYSDHADLDKLMANSALHQAFNDLALTKPPVLHCYYGPMALEKDGGVKTGQYVFWYKAKPDGLAALLAADKGIGALGAGLHLSAETCPDTDIGARQLISTANQ